ncbi:unnamed protein product [Arctia plantaginis]|uniref:Uncharacterized protein n=1 Tax=Arctia plantaginis TaxID=874455 RepID=A0A8S1BDN0_ARCPL|nr:unnamed protein product [Arctia plantaginis]
MMFKLIVSSVACIFIAQPVQCGIISNLSNIKTAAVGTVSDIASIVPNVITAKGSAVLQAAAETGNIIAVSAGLKAEALERLSTSITDSISEGLVSVGRRLSRQGTGLVEDTLANSDYAGLGVVSTKVLYLIV